MKWNEIQNTLKHACTSSLFKANLISNRIYFYAHITDLFDKYIMKGVNSYLIELKNHVKAIIISQTMEGVHCYKNHS